MPLLDNKETPARFLAISKNRKGQNVHGSNYFKTKGKHINLTLAKILENSMFKDDEYINKQIRRLRYCSTLTLLKSDFTSNIQLVKSSKRCKSAHCAICRRAKSARLASRLISAIIDDENKEIFENMKFYFLTITMKHDEHTRNYNYLKEFKKDCSKLRRRKIYKNHFIGGLVSVENVISDEYHIHSHSLLTSNSINDTKGLQLELRKAWRKITKDSFMIDLREVDNENLMGSIMEVVKYSTKIMKMENMKDGEIENLANWIIDTKGQNFVNLLGNWKTLDITSNKSKYDTKIEEGIIDKSDIITIGRTSKQKFNFNTQRNYSKEGREHRRKHLYLKQIDEDAIFADGEETIYFKSLLSEDFANEQFEELKEMIKEGNFEFEI